MSQFIHFVVVEINPGDPITHLVGRDGDAIVDRGSRGHAGDARRAASRVGADRDDGNRDADH